MKELWILLWIVFSPPDAQSPTGHGVFLHYSEDDCHAHQFTMHAQNNGYNYNIQHNIKPGIQALLVTKCQLWEIQI